MIYRLRKKFIGIVTVSFISVFLILLLFISIFTMIQTNSSLDTLADIVSANDGKFPAFEEFGSGGNQPSRPPDINQESQFTTRFFTVHFDLSGQLLSADIHAVASVTKDDAISYAKEVLKGGQGSRLERGFPLQKGVHSNRYKCYFYKWYDS